MFTISNDQEAPSTFHLMFFEVLNQVMFNIIILNCLYNFEKYLFLVEMNLEMLNEENMDIVIIS